MNTLKVGHVVSDDEIPISYLFNLCMYQVSKKIKHLLIINKNYDFLRYFRQKNIPCIMVSEKMSYRDAFRKMDIIDLHWFKHHKDLHDVVNALRIPYLVTLYGAERLPASVLHVICPFEYIKKVQRNPVNFTVIREGLDLNRISRYRNRHIYANKKAVLIAPDRITQVNDMFWMIMQEALALDPLIELQIISPGWRSLKQIKAINCKEKSEIYSSIAKADLALYLPYNSEIAKIQDSLHFVKLAMAIGIPVVVSRHALTCELIQNRKTGIVLPRKSLTRSAQNLINFLHNAAEKKKYAFRARQIIWRKFDIKTSVEQYESMLFKVSKKSYSGQ